MPTTGPEAATTSNPDTFHPASPLTKADIQPTGVDGVRHTTEVHHARRGRPPAEAPRKMDVHHSKRRRGYETSHKHKLNTGSSEVKVQTQDEGETSEQSEPRVLRPPKEGEPITVEPIEMPAKLPPGPLETVAKESSDASKTVEKESDDSTQTDETASEKKPTGKPKRPSVLRRELNQQIRDKDVAQPAVEGKETEDHPPDGWKVEPGKVELPDGRRIVKNVETGKLVVVETKDKDGNDLSPDKFTVQTSKPDETEEQFLKRVASVEPGAIPSIQKVLDREQTQTSIEAEVEVQPTEEESAESRPSTKVLEQNTSEGGKIEPSKGQEVELYGGHEPVREGEPLKIAIGMTEDSERREARQAGRVELTERGQEYNQGRVDFVRRHAGDNPSRLARAAYGLMYAVRHPAGAFENVIQQRLGKVVFKRRFADQAIESGEVQGLLDAEKFSTLQRLILAQETPEATELVHEGERLIGREDPELVTLRENIQDSMRGYIDGSLAEADFREAINRSLVGVSWMETRNAGGGEQIAQRVDNIQEVADYFRLALAHGESLESIDEKLANMELVVGEVQMGSRSESEGHEEMIDRTIERLAESRVGSLVNEATIGLAVTTIYAVAKLATQKLTGKAAAVGATVAATATVGVVAIAPAIIAGAAVAGVVAYYRERYSGRQERVMVARQRAVGEQDATGQEAMALRRAEIQGSLYDMESAETIITDGNDIVGESFDILNNPAGLTRAETDAAMDRLALFYVRSRTLVELSDQEQIDLIQYNPGGLERQRFDIDRLTAVARGILRDYAEAHPDFLADRGAVDVTEHLANGMNTLSVDLHERAGGIDERDRTFNRLNRDQSLRVGVATLVSGFVFGAGAKEITSLISGGPGVIESQTITTQVMPSGAGELPYGGAPQELVLGKNVIAFAGNELRLPNGLEYKPLGNGNFAIQDLRTGETIVQQVTLDPSGNGALSAETATALRSHGVMIAETHGQIDLGPITHTSSLPEYIQAHPDQFTEVTRNWEHNMTTIFDKNELAGHIRVQGDQVVFDMSHMTPNGSYNQFGAVDAVEGFQSGRAHFLFSLDEAHQSTPLDLPVNSDGTISMPIDSDLTRSLITVNPDGTWDLKAAYWEVALDSGKTAPNGSHIYDILATAKGDNSVGTITTSVPNIHETTQTVLDVKAPPVDIPINETTYQVDPWFIPLVTRRIVENARPQEGERETAIEETPVETPPPPGPPTPPPPGPPTPPPPGNGETEDGDDVVIEGGDTEVTNEVNNVNEGNDVNIDNSDEVHVEVVNEAPPAPINPEAPSIVVNVGNITNSGSGPLIINIPININGTQTTNQTVTIDAPVEETTTVQTPVSPTQIVDVEQTTEITTEEVQNTHRERIKRIGDGIDDATKKLSSSLLIVLSRVRQEQTIVGDNNIGLQAGRDINIFGDEAIRRFSGSVRDVAESAADGDVSRADIRDATEQADTLSSRIAGIEGEDAERARADLVNLRSQLNSLESYVSGETMTLRDVVSVAQEYVDIMEQFKTTFGIGSAYVDSNGGEFSPRTVINSLIQQVSRASRGLTFNTEKAQNNVRLVGEIFRIYSAFTQECANAEFRAKAAESKKPSQTVAQDVAEELKPIVEKVAGAEVARQRTAA